MRSRRRGAEARLRSRADAPPVAPPVTPPVAPPVAPSRTLKNLDSDVISAPLSCSAIGCSLMSMWLYTTSDFVGTSARPRCFERAAYLLRCERSKEAALSSRCNEMRRSRLACKQISCIMMSRNK